jgi:ATP synthase protein I
VDATSALGAAPEGAVARDLARRALLVTPLVLLATGLIGGAAGAASAAIGLALVALNFLASASVIGWAAQRSQAAVLGAVLGGYVVRLGVILGVVLALQSVSWINVAVLVVTIAVTHLALVTWELRFVSFSLAAPGLKPSGK